MRRRSPAYSPPPRRGRARSRSPSPSPRGRYPTRREPLREPPTSLLVRNLPKSCRAEDLRAPFKRFGPLRDIYLPRDYYTGEPRGFGFVQYLDPLDAEEAQYHMNRQVLYGREVTVVFAEENRKKPVQMRKKERVRGRGLSEDNGGSYYSHRGRSRTRSRSRSRTPPRRHRYTRSPFYEERRDVSPPKSPARTPSEERHQHRRGRHEGGRSGSESRRYGEERSRSGSPVSPDGRYAQKGSDKHGSYSDAQRLDHDRSHSSRHVQPESPPRSSRRRRSPSHSGGSSPERYSRSPSRSPPPRRGRSSRRSDSRSQSPPENQYRHGSSEDRGASSEHSSMDD